MALFNLQGRKDFKVWCSNKVLILNFGTFRRQKRQMTYFQRNIAELSHFIEMPEGVMEVFPSLASLKDVGSIRLIFGFRRPVSRSLLFGLRLLLWHHVPRCHRRLQATTPTKTEFTREVKTP